MLNCICRLDETAARVMTAATCKEKLCQKVNVNIYFLGMIEIPKVILDCFCFLVQWAS